MRLLLAIGIAQTIAAGTVLAQCPGCPSAGGCSSMSGQTSGLSGLKLSNLAGDTIKLSEHIGMMPMVMLLAGADEASGRAADVVQAAISSLGEQQPMLVTALAAGPKTAKTFASAHGLSGLVLVDQKKTALAAAMADTLPLVLFIGKSGAIVKADARITAATVKEGMTAMAQTEEKLVDPVCGMTVTREHAAATYDFQGKTYYFCSTACRDDFVKDPQKYLAQ
jgi:YHS domain-containing protein